MKNLLKAGLEKLNKENKELNAIKLLKGVYTRKFAEIVENLKSKKINLEDLEIYTNHFPDFEKVVNDYKHYSAELKRKEEFDKIVQMDKPVAEQYLQDCQKQLHMVAEALENARNEKVYSDSGIVSKNDKISKLEQKTNDLNLTIECLNIHLKNSAPLKRPVGRPKKQI